MKLMSLADIQFTGQEYWRPINDQQLTAIHSKAQMLLYGGASGGGKRLDIETPIPTPTGWTDMGSLQVGDPVFDESGNVAEVTFASPIRVATESYRVIFDDGS